MRFALADNEDEHNNQDTWWGSRWPINRGTCIHVLIVGEAGGQWSLRRAHESWVLEKPASEPADASVTLDQESAWRLFTKGISQEEAFQKGIFQGNAQLARKVLDTIAIIA